LIGGYQVVRILAVTCISLTLATGAFAQCHVPDYLQGATLSDSKSEVITNISIDLEDFTPNRLVCLARSLKERYRGRSSIDIGIFSSQAAATYLRQPALPLEPQAEDYEMFKQMHASYLFRPDIHDDYILLMPDPMIDAPGAAINTKIDLSAAIVPACKLQINNRCLLAFDHIDPPRDETSGSVTLIAEIERVGSVSGIHVVDVSKNGSWARKSLADFALQNLKTWRFESSQSKNDIRIVYSLERVMTPLEHGINVQFMLPDSITIQVGPLLRSY
jgi:hypothetical protein